MTVCRGKQRGSKICFPINLINIAIPTSRKGTFISFFPNVLSDILLEINRVFLQIRL